MFTYDSLTNGLFIFKESTIKVAGKAGKKQDKAKSDKPSTAKSGQKSEKKVRIKYKVKEQQPALGMLVYWFVLLFSSFCVFT